MDTLTPTIKDRVDQVITDYFAKHAADAVAVSVIADDLNRVLGRSKTDKKLNRLVSHMAQKAGWKVIRSAGETEFYVQREKGQTLGSFLIMAREIADAKVREEEAARSDYEEMQRQIVEKAHEFVRANIPEPVHSFVFFERDSGEGEYYFRLVIPNCAPIRIDLFGYENGDGEQVFNFCKPAFWVLEPKLEVVDPLDLFEIWEVVDRRRAGYDYDRGYEAIACAAGVGNTKTRKQKYIAEAERRNADSAVQKAHHDSLPVCPLTLNSANHIEGRKCIEQRCAWFVAYKGMNACSLKVLANRAADGMEME